LPFPGPGSSLQNVAPVLKPEDLRAFVHRRWDLVEREKVRFLADRFASGGSSAARAAAQRLFRRWQALHANGISPERRAADLASHLALKQKLDRAGHALRGY
jgi:hypothetical protein